MLYNPTETNYRKRIETAAKNIELEWNDSPTLDQQAEAIKRMNVLDLHNDR